MSTTVFLNRLRGIYHRIDREFAELEEHYGFRCTGCLSNCCTTYFYHHTVVEYLYLLRGMQTMDRETHDAALERADRMCQLEDTDQYLCPLNVQGLCTIYSFRPMICRIHGLPWELMQPDGQRRTGPGCAPLERRISREGLAYRRMDRTPFFRDLALLEREVRHLLQGPQRVRKTTAEMVVEYDLCGGAM